MRRPSAVACPRPSIASSRCNNSRACVNVANGGTVQAGNGASGSLAIANLVLGTTTGDLATLRFRNIDLGASASVLNLGTLTANGGAGSVAITAVNGGALANGTYLLANFTTAVTDFSVFTVGSISGLGGRQSGTPGSAGGRGRSARDGR